MARLIDADALKAAMKAVKSGLDFPLSTYLKRIIAMILDGAPTVDAIPVVRCKDCKHKPIDNREMDNDMTGFAIEFPDGLCPCQCEDGWYNWYPTNDWFCGNGERRDDDGRRDEEALEFRANR